MEKKHKDLLLNILIGIIVLIFIFLVGFVLLKSMGSQIESFESECTRISMNEFEDNCFCPCDEPNWIERKLELGILCDGWIVNKNESCINTFLG